MDASVAQDRRNSPPTYRLPEMSHLVATSGGANANYTSLRYNDCCLIYSTSLRQFLSCTVTTKCLFLNTWFHSASATATAPQCTVATPLEL